MAVKLKRIEDQVVVITGASSGIGLATAKMAAERGARVVLVARDPDGLASARVEIEGAGGRAISVVADVAKIVEMRNGVSPSSRAAGGSVENSTDWPMPMHTRPTNRMRNARRSVAVMNGQSWHIVEAGTNARGFARLARVRITIACPHSTASAPAIDST